MGVCTAVMFLTQAAIHIFGPFGLLPYTGITLPFTSGGFNSLFVCSVLLVTTEILPKRKQNAVPPEPCTDRELHASPGSLPEMLPTRRF